MLKHLLFLVFMIVGSSFANAKSHYTIDRQYCHVKAFLAQAGAEARRRGEDRETWLKTLTLMKAYSPADSLVRIVYHQSLYDIDVVYNDRLNVKPHQMYIDVFRTCADFGGRVVAYY